MKRTRSRREMLNMRRIPWITGTKTGKQAKNKRSLSAGRYKAAIPMQYIKTTESSIPDQQSHSRSLPQQQEIRRNSDNSLRSIMCPKFNQAFLAFSTLLLLASLECLILSVITVKPGLIGMHFSPTQCTVVNKLFNGNITCYVDSMQEHGTPRLQPCLQVYVKPNTELQINKVSRSNKSLLNNTTTRNIFNYTPSHEMSVFSASALIGTTATSTNSPSVAVSSTDTTGILLLYQNEISYAGMDYLYRRCTYLPSYCSPNEASMLADISEFAYDVGSLNSVVHCYYDAEGKRVILNKTIIVADVVNALLWPILGIIISTVCCVGFWRKNYKRRSRLYVYNSWSAS